MTSITLEHILVARQKISSMAVRTPLIPSPFLSAKAGAEFLLKLELAQPMGAFKLRGAANAILNLDLQNCQGVTCASTGNHGRAVAYAANKLGIRAVICMSDLVPKAKLDGIKALGAEVRITGHSQDDAFKEVSRLVTEDGLTEISPFDDPDVISGQGTIGLELLESRPDLQTIIIPLSGGGLAGGIAIAAKSIKPDISIIGVTMDRGPAMKLSIEASQPVDVIEVPSLADSLGGGIGQDNRWSLDVCKKYIDDVVLVSEEEIYHAMQALYFEDRIVAEGGCVVGIAALLSNKLSRFNGPVATILSGRNIDMQLHSSVMAGEDITLGDLKLNGKKYN